MKEVNPQTTTRAYAFEFWMKAPMPIVKSCKSKQKEKSEIQYVDVLLHWNGCK